MGQIFTSVDETDETDGPLVSKLLCYYESLNTDGKNYSELENGPLMRNSPLGEEGERDDVTIETIERPMRHSVPEEFFCWGM